MNQETPTPEDFNVQVNYVYNLIKGLNLDGLNDLPNILEDILENKIASVDYLQLVKLLFTLEEKLYDKGYKEADVKSRLAKFYSMCETLLGRELFRIGDTVYTNKTIEGKTLDSARFPMGLQGRVVQSQFIGSIGEIVVRFEHTNLGDVYTVNPEDPTPIPINQTIRATAYKLKIEDVTKKPVSNENVN